MKRRKRAMKSSAIICVVTLIACALLCMLPERYQNASSLIPRERVRIDEVNNDALFPLGIVYSGVQGCKVTVLSGEHEGESAWASNYLNSALDKDKLFEQGDIAHAMVQTGPQGLTVTLIDHDRTGAELAILLSLSALLLLYGGLVGFGALVSLVASVLIVWKLLLPLLIEGVNPIGAAFLTVVALTVIIDLLVGGLSRKTLVAVIGSLLGTVVTCVLAVALTDALKLDGGDVPYLVPLLSQAHMDIDARALFCGMMFIANSGALMDLAMDISASTEEICRHKPDIAFRDLLLSGMTIGRYTLGTMTTTLMLAYSGNYLSMLMYFMGQGTPVIDIINLKYVASQLLNTLVGSFGLVAAAPLSALTAAWIYTRPGARAARMAMQGGAPREGVDAQAPAEAAGALR